MENLPTLIQKYFEPFVSSQSVTSEELNNSNSIIVRLPLNVYIAGEYLSNILEQNYPIGVVNKFHKFTNVDTNGIIQYIYIFIFKQVLYNSPTVLELHKNIISYGYYDLNLGIDTIILPTRLFCDLEIEKLLLLNNLKEQEQNNNGDNILHLLNEKFAILKIELESNMTNTTEILKKEISSNYESFEGFIESDITHVNEENANLAKRISELEQLIIPLSEKLSENETKLADVTKRIDCIKESTKWDTKFLYNKIDMLKHDMIDYVVEKTEAITSRIRKRGSRGGRAVRNT
jgi:hypothetical protein